MSYKNSQTRLSPLSTLAEGDYVRATVGDSVIVGQIRGISSETGGVAVVAYGSRDKLWLNPEVWEITEL